MNNRRKYIQRIFLLAWVIVIQLGLHQKVLADDLYRSSAAAIKLDYTDYKSLYLDLPEKGYIIISTTDSMVEIGVDDLDTRNAKKIYNGDSVRFELTKGAHNIYLFDAAGATVWTSESAVLQYNIYLYKTPVVPTESPTSNIRETEDYKYYIIQGDCCGIKKYLGDDEVVQIPAKIEGYKVIEIGEKAFDNNEYIEKVTIPNSVEIIKESAFDGCEELRTVTFEKASSLKKIDENAFNVCTRLKNVTIPKSVISIGERAFSSCTSLQEVKFEKNSNIEVIGKYAFDACYKLTSIKIPHSVKILNPGAFSSCKRLKKVIFEKNCKIESIQKYTFEECVAMTKIVIPKSVKIIDENAFRDADELVNVSFEKGSRLQSIKRMAFGGCWNLVKIDITSKQLKRVEKNAFYKIDSDCNIQVPKSRLAKYKKLINKKTGISSNVKISGK